MPDREPALLLLDANAPLRPILPAFAEPLERLLAALCPHSMVFLLRGSAAIPADWLTAMRLHRHLLACLMEPAHTDVWPLLPNVWALSLQVAGRTDDPDESMHLHSLARALCERLNADWRGGEKETEAEAIHNPQSTIHNPIYPTPSSFHITPIAPLRARAEMEENISELNALLEIIVNKQLHAQFQPIINLADGQVFGYEALIRGPKGGALRRSSALFRAASKARMVSWYDLACQEACFARAAQQGLRHHLFINMEAEGLDFVDMHDRPLVARARECGLNPASIVVEITERQAIADFPRLVSSLARLREQGFKIAIDDAGAGYNSLHAIAELRPDFVKIDRSLVRNLDVNGERRALLSALVTYARSIGTYVLAEGAETHEELATLIDLGVTYGQGYLMGKPADSFRGVPCEVRAFIQQRHRQRVQMSAGRMVCVSGIMRPGKTLPPEAPLAQAATGFYKNPGQTSVVVVEEGIVRGLLMRQSLDHILELARSARMDDLLPDETVAQWMTTQMLCVREDDTVSEAARQATTRSDLSLEADIIVADSGNHYVGVLPMRVLMEAVTTLQENRARYADPLTGLPNRVPLEQAVSERLEERREFALARIDLTGLNFYNRAYGLPHGDTVLHTLSRLIQAATKQDDGKPCPEAEAFVAHLGGDDFVVLNSVERMEGFCKTLLEEFARQSPLFYTAEQAGSSTMEVPERNGGTRRVPLLACRIAVLTTRARKFTHTGQMLEEAHRLLHQVKHRPGHSFAINRVES